MSSLGTSKYSLSSERTSATSLTHPRKDGMSGLSYSSMPTRTARILLMGSWPLKPAYCLTSPRRGQKALQRSCVVDIALHRGYCSEMLCERCGRENPDGFRFCGACGASLTAPLGAGIELGRKVVSALFCDLVGFLARRDHGPEDVHEMLRMYYASVRGEFEGFRGTVAKFIGDAVFVLFGAPRARGRRARRSCRLGRVDAVAKLNAAHRTRPASTSA
jgi:hypothetical protein